MGRRKIEIKKIENKAYLKATFSKRRNGLFRKASELCDLCGAEIAILTVSPGGKFYNFGHPDVDYVVARYCGDEIPIVVNEKRDCVLSHEDDDEDLEGEQEREVSTDEVDEVDEADEEVDEVDEPMDIGSSSHKASEENEVIHHIKELNLIEQINRQRDGTMRKSLLLQKWWDEEMPTDPEQFQIYHHSLIQLRNNLVSVLNDRKMRESYTKDYTSMI